MGLTFKVTVSCDGKPSGIPGRNEPCLDNAKVEIEASYDRRYNEYYPDLPNGWIDWNDGEYACPRCRPA